MALCLCGGPQECPVHRWRGPTIRKINHLRKYGLKDRLHVNVCPDGFVSVHTHVQPGFEWIPIRISDAWPKHISFGWLPELNAGDLSEFRRRWNGKITHLKFWGYSGGGTGLLAGCDLTWCPFFRRLRRQGYYHFKPDHISFWVGNKVCSVLFWFRCYIYIMSEKWSSIVF